MKLIIDISEDVYTRLFDNGIQDNEIATDDICEMARSLRQGTPLPKGHGDLIDRNDLLKHYDNTTYHNGIEERKIHFVQIGYVNDAPTIIEADKAESEDKG
jgi:hypothetical protein